MFMSRTSIDNNKITEKSEDRSICTPLSHHLVSLVFFSDCPFSTCPLFPPTTAIWITVLRNGPIALRVVLLHLGNASRQWLLAFVSHQLELLAADRGILRLCAILSAGNLSFSIYIYTRYLSSKVYQQLKTNKSIINNVFKSRADLSFSLIPPKQRVVVFSRLTLLWN